MVALDAIKGRILSKSVRDAGNSGSHLLLDGIWKEEVKLNCKTVCLRRRSKM